MPGGQSCVMLLAEMRVAWLGTAARLPGGVMLGQVDRSWAAWVSVTFSRKPEAQSM